MSDTRSRVHAVRQRAALGVAFDFADAGPERRKRWFERLAFRRIDAALQIAIAVLSLIAIALVATDGPAHRWGFVLGLASQPLWIAATWRARQWGMLIVAIFYCGAWTGGILIRF